MRQLKITTSVTNRDSQALEKYLQEIGKIDLISPEREVELAIKIKAGDQAALDELVNANLRFVVSVAKQYQHQGLSLSDLINEGNLGLITAAQRFDETRGFKFISYAVWWIRQSIMLGLIESGNMVRKPMNKVSLMKKVNDAELLLLQTLERQPTEEELLELLQQKKVKIDMHTLQLSLESRGKHSSLDAPVGEDGDTTVGGLTEAEADEHQRASISQEMREAVRVGLQTSRLTELQKMAIIAHFSIESGITKESVLANFDIKESKFIAAYKKGIEKLQRDRNFKAIISGEKLSETQHELTIINPKKITHAVSILNRKEIIKNKTNEVTQTYWSQDNNEEILLPSNHVVNGSDHAIKGITFFHSPAGMPIKETQARIIDILGAENNTEVKEQSPSTEETSLETAKIIYVQPESVKTSLAKLSVFLDDFEKEEHNTMRYVALTKREIPEGVEQTVLLFFFLYAIDKKKIDADIVTHYIQRECQYIGLGKPAIVKMIIEGYKKITSADNIAKNGIR